MEIKVITDTKALETLGVRAKKIMPASEKALDNWSKGVLRKIKISLTGQKLHVRTGRLRDSISYKIEKTQSILRSIFGTNVKYAAIHEYGGKTPAHMILPKVKKALAFGSETGYKYIETITMTGKTRRKKITLKEIVVKKVHHPGSKISEKRYMREPIEQDFEILKDTLDLCIREALNAE